MPQDDLKPNDKSNFPRFRPKADNENGGNNTPRKGPKFNIYWVWGIIAVGLLAFQFWGGLSGGDSHKLDSDQEFWEQMLQKGDVSKIDLIPNKNLVRVYIKKDSLDKPYYKDKLSKGWPGVSKADGPQFEFLVVKIDEYEKRLNEFFAKNPSLSVAVSIKPEAEWFPQVLNILLPVLILGLLWVLIMRKMGGQSGSGGPGGIFNIGKSKATLFDKGTKVNITFSDVAGLDEAKVEVMEIVDFLKNPKKYTALGGKIPKGALLVGPSGNRKNLACKSHGGRSPGSVLFYERF